MGPREAIGLGPHVGVAQTPHKVGASAQTNASSSAVQATEPRVSRVVWQSSTVPCATSPGRRGWRRQEDGVDASATQGHPRRRLGLPGSGDARPHRASSDLGRLSRTTWSSASISRPAAAWAGGSRRSSTPRARPAPWKIVVVTGAPSWAEYWAPVLAALPRGPRDDRGRPAGLRRQRAVPLRPGHPRLQAAALAAAARPCQGSEAHPGRTILWRRDRHPDGRTPNRRRSPAWCCCRAIWANRARPRGGWCTGLAAGAA